MYEWFSKFKKILIYIEIRRFEDEMSYWLGPVFVKFLRLFMNLGISIHFFCCAYWRVKVSNIVSAYIASLQTEVTTHTQKTISLTLCSLLGLLNAGRKSQTLKTFQLSSRPRTSKKMWVHLEKKSSIHFSRTHAMPICIEAGRMLCRNWIDDIDLLVWMINYFPPHWRSDTDLKARYDLFDVLLVDMTVLFCLALFPCYNISVHECSY